MEISASILNVKEEEAIHTFYRIETAKTDYFHIDVMDGKFVENDTSLIMQKYADNLKNITNLPLDVHLMVDDVKKYIDIFASCEPDTITFHIEKSGIKDNNLGLIESDEIESLIEYIKKSNCKVGIAIDPKTDIKEVYKYLKNIHRVLIMSVWPGRGGQKYIEETNNKIIEIKNYLKENNLETEIEVDGGINDENITELKKEEIDIAVVGSYLINSKDYKFTINKLKS